MDIFQLMYKTICFALCYLGLALLSQICRAQEISIPLDSTTTYEPLQDSIITDSTQRFSYERALYGEIGVGYASQYNTCGFSRQVGLGMSFEGWALGILYIQYKSKNADSPFFPRDVRFEYELISGSIARRIILLKNWHASGKINVNYGSANWLNEDSKRIEFSDRFYIFTPEVEIAYSIFPFIQLLGALGYRLPYNMSIPALNPSTLQGMVYSIGIRFGYFHQPPNK